MLSVDWLPWSWVSSVICAVSIRSVVGLLLSESLSDSGSRVSFDDFVNRPSGPRSPVPLLFGSCANSEIGLLMCFLCSILYSAVVTVCFVPDITVCSLSENALSNFSLFVFFKKLEWIKTDSFSPTLLFHR